MHFRRERKNAPTLSLQETLDAGKEDSALTLADVLQDGFCMEDSCEKQDDAQRLRRLIEGGAARMSQLFARSQSRSTNVATFLALLELVRGGRVTLGPKGELTMQRGRLPRERAKEEE